MSYCVGIDLSSRAIDIVKLEEDSNRAEWFRFSLEGASAWERTRVVRQALPSASWWDDVYLAAVETPFPDQKGVLRRVQGAVMASIPPEVLVWEANASEWKRELGLKGKPSWEDIEARAPFHRVAAQGDAPSISISTTDDRQDCRDAYCIALWARESNRRGIEAA